MMAPHVSSTLFIVHRVASSEKTLFRLLARDDKLDLREQVPLHCGQQRAAIEI
jgi:hypothetical protein